MAVHRKSSAGGSSKNIDKPIATHQTIPPAVFASTPSSTKGTSWTILSTTDAWNFSRCVTEFLEDLKNREVNWEGTPFIPFAT
jgi:hypothetical protein